MRSFASSRFSIKPCLSTVRTLYRLDAMAEETPAWKVAGVVLFYMAVALVMVMV